MSSRKSFELDDKSLALLTDFYELTMANGYLSSGRRSEIAYFDMFFRKIPDGGGFAIMAGVEQLIDYIKNLSFTEEDIEFLKSKNIFSAEFLEYLKNFKFTCDVWAVPEGTPVFPQRTHCHGARAGYRGAVYRVDGAACRKPPISYSDQGQPHGARCRGT